MHWVWVGVALAGAAQGLTGFGFGIVGMAVLTPVVGPKLANLIVTPLAGVNVAVSLWDVRQFIDWRRVWPLWCGGLLGTPLGVHVLLHADPLLLRRLVGLAILTAAIQSFYAVGKPSNQRPHSAWWGLAAGTLGGVTGGAVSMAGPPAVVYVYRQPWPLGGVKATLLLFFAGTIVARLVMLIRQGAYTAPLLGTVLPMLPLVATTSWIGTRLTRRVARRHVDRVVGILLALAGLLLLLPPAKP